MFSNNRFEIIYWKGKGETGNKTSFSFYFLSFLKK
ncbi:hypothetical protein BACCAC_01269 [Bacteroides caccae ATCC 43185]|nr:hypothetical protein BACCAC_01269 [Bacteroides caccae ATCC 43185]